MSSLPPKPTWGLSARLGWRLALVMLAGITLAAVGVGWRTLATIRSLDDAALQSQARLVAGRVEAGADGGPIIRLPDELRAAFDATDGSSVYFVTDAAGRVMLASDPRTAETLRPYVPAGGFFRAPSTAAYPYGFLGFVAARPPWRVVVAQQHEQQEALVASLSETFLGTALWLLLPLMAATVAIGIATLRGGLRPLRRASEVAARVGPAAPGVRLPSVGLPRELAPLVATVNEALDRLERALESQRRFAGDAAHALRTPIAIMAARLEALEDRPELASLRADAGRLARLVGQMLTLARLDGLPPDLVGRFDLRAVAASVVADLAPLADQRDVALALTGGSGALPARGDAASVELALRNLLDNAIQHAPPGSEVEVALEAPATVRVMDRGLGVPEAARAAIFARFHTGRPGGAGLGLAIVAGVAAAHGGSVWTEPRAGGGAVFAIRLPG